MKNVAATIYILFGTAALVLSLVALIKPELAVHPDQRTPLTAHLVREQASAGLFIGLMAFWCFLHMEERRPVHLALLVYTAVFAAIHWAGWMGSGRSVLGAIPPTIPFVLLLVATPRRRLPDLSTGPLRR